MKVETNEFKFKLIQKQFRNWNWRNKSINKNQNKIKIKIKVNTIVRIQKKKRKEKLVGCVKFCFEPGKIEHAHTQNNKSEKTRLTFLCSSSPLLLLLLNAFTKRSCASLWWCLVQAKEKQQRRVRIFDVACDFYPCKTRVSSKAS